MSIPLGWMQLKHRKLRLVVALAGIAFAVVLILMQLGFRGALFDSAVHYHEEFRYDVVLLSKETWFLVRPQPFSSRRLYQALAVAGVESVTPVYLQSGIWKNPWTNIYRSIYILGIDPGADVLDAPGVRENLPRVSRRDAVLFDVDSRPEFGPVAAHLRAGEKVFTEVNERRVQVVGLYEMGPSFGVDGAIITSDSNFLRLFPTQTRTQIDLGFIHVSPGIDPVRVRDRLRALLPEDVLVLTKPGFVAREHRYWDATTPIGYVFAFGSVIGFVVGCIIVYQILFADVSDHLPEYATLKAMGYSNRYLSGVVIQQALILSFLGYLPGMAVSLWLYRTAGEATHLPMHLTPERAAGVLLLTVVMCAGSGLLALRKVRSVDPAEIF